MTVIGTVARRAAPIELSGVTKRFVTPSGSSFTALRDVDLTIGAGMFSAVVGPTGCGKSTTLTMVSGLDRPSAGVVRVGGQLVDGITAGTSFMFQAERGCAPASYRSVTSGQTSRKQPDREQNAQN